MYTMCWLIPGLQEVKTSLNAIFCFICLQIINKLTNIHGCVRELLYVVIFVLFF